ncbi:hypothetical protein [Thermotomaculum hydrothermale]|uniref:hypothetical protein n=1 Tax=Thermotomaculum hydrothermale TaxID=981385 RepID=UPI0019160555|nr:hypothetical protein [Thermotomaculum hydrothermale]
MSTKDELKSEFLHKLYELSREKGYEPIDMYEVGKELGFDKGLTKEIVLEYLVKEGLVQIVGLGGFITITKKGINEVENA